MHTCGLIVGLDGSGCGLGVMLWPEGSGGEGARLRGCWERGTGLGNH